MLGAACVPVNHLKCLLCSGSLKESGQPINRVAIRFKHRTALTKSYQTLGLVENCEDEELRQAFVHLAKQYHPDSTSSTADAKRFSEVESAYRNIRRQRNADKDSNSQLPDVEEFDIHHTAPQHRHFLTYDTGIGTPSQRQRRFTVERAQRAVENVMEHRLKIIQATERNTLVGKDKRRAKDIKTRYGIDRLVEDLIQEAMNKGEFSHLSGMGKPLKDRSSEQNPHVDFVTHKLNEILIDNGFTPEWIQLSKEIREETRDLQELLNNTRETLGPHPFSSEDEAIWRKTLKSANDTTSRINKKINNYNLLVPILQKQMVQINLRGMEEKALEKLPNSRSKKNAENQVTIPGHKQQGLLEFIFSSFESKKS